MPAIGKFIWIGKGGGAASAIPPDGSPYNLTIDIISDTEISLSWDSTSTDQSGYRVFISTNGENFTPYGTTTETSLLVEDLTPETLYYFYVIAYKGAGISDESNYVSGATYFSLLFDGPHQVPLSCKPPYTL